MNVTVIIATYGEQEWAQLAWRRARPSAEKQATEVFTLHYEDATIAQARNEAAKWGSGEWLCFLDADDELGPGYFEAMERALEQERGTEGSDPLLLTPAVSYVRKGRPMPPKFHPEGNLQDDNWIVVGTLVERALFESVGGFGDYPHGFEDWSLWAKCWKAGARIVKVKQAIYYAHINPQSKHRVAWKNREWQVAMHNQIRAELFPELV